MANTATRGDSFGGTNCNHCFARVPKVLRCAGCGVVAYCGGACQKAHWKGGHKAECKRLRKERKAPAGQADATLGALARDRRAMRYMHKGDWASAEREFRAILAAMPPAAPGAPADAPKLLAMACSNLGSVLEPQGKLAEAIEHHRRAVAAHPAYLLGHTNLARALLRAGALEPCLAAARKAACLAKGQAAAGGGSAQLADVFVKAARVRWESGDAPGARALQREALAVDPAHGPAHHQASHLLFELFYKDMGDLAPLRESIASLSACIKCTADPALLAELRPDLARKQLVLATLEDSQG